jgi:hypothetical protein
MQAVYAIVGPLSVNDIIGNRDESVDDQLGRVKMPDIPVTTPLGYIGVFLAVFGFFLILAGFNIIRVEKIIVEPGRKTWMFGIGLVIVGIAFLFPDIHSSLQSSFREKGVSEIAEGAESAESVGDAVTGSTSFTATIVSPCFEAYFSGIPADRISTLERGFEDVKILDTTQSKEEVIGIQFSEFGEPIGAIKLYPMPPSNFKIETIVNAACQEIEDYYETDGARDPQVLRNGHELQITFTDAEYRFSLYFSTPDQETVWGSFLKASP